MKPLLLSTVLTLFSSLLIAQTFAEIDSGLEVDSIQARSIAYADIDGDTDLDLIIVGFVAGTGRVSRLYTNDGTGQFNEVSGTAFEGIMGSVAFFDVDNDDDEDLFLTGINSADVRLAKLYLNDGLGQFTEVPNTPFAGVTSGVRNESIAIADIDGDNDLDLLICGRDDTNMLVTKLYTNNGTGLFTEVAASPFTDMAGAVEFADIDGDDDPDLLLSGIINNNNFFVKLYTNDGAGNFSEVLNTPFEELLSESIVFSDIDGDNDLDVFMTGMTSFNSPSSKLYTNDGTGVFYEVLNSPIVDVFHSSAAFADIDGDNDQDLLLSGYVDAFTQITKLYVNNGIGNFTELLDTPFEQVAVGTVAFLDVDNDNDQDVLVDGLNNTPGLVLKLYANNGLISSIENQFNALDFEVDLFPNPVIGDEVKVCFTLEHNATLKFSLFDLNGRQWMQRQAHLSAGFHTFSIDIATLTTGTYLLQIEDGEQNGIFKIQVPE